MNTETQIVEYSTPPPLKQFLPAAQHPARVYLATLAKSGRVTQQQALDKAALLLSSGKCDHETLDWSQVRFSHVAALKTHLTEKHSFQYVNKILAAVKGTAKAAWQLEQLSDADLMRIRSVQSVKGEALPAGRALSYSELRRIGTACHDGTLRGIRDAAAIALLVGAGLRRSEPINLDIDDYNATDETLTIRNGKGNKDRIAAIADDSAEHVNTWLQYRPDVAGPLLLCLKKGGIIVMRRLSHQNMYAILAYRAAIAGVSCTPHDLRRTFVSEALDQGHNIAVVQKQCGHSSAAITARYDRSGVRAQLKMARSLNNLNIGAVPHE